MCGSPGDQGDKTVLPRTDFLGVHLRGVKRKPRQDLIGANQSERAGVVSAEAAIPKFQFVLTGWRLQEFWCACVRSSSLKCCFKSSGGVLI